MVLAAVLIRTPTWMAAAAAVAVAAVVVTLVRRVGLGRGPSTCVAVGLAAWAAAAGSPVWVRPVARSVAVMVDLSPSTRGASYRDRATLDRRVAELVGDTPVERFAFADGPARPLPAGATLADLPCDATRYPPPLADAVLLFSDGRFAPPAVGPPTFVVVDPDLDAPPDAAVRDLRWSTDAVLATVAAGAGRTDLRWVGADPPTADVTGGGVVFARPTATEVTAVVDGHDRWPENDRLTIHAPPPPTAERLWVGGSPAPPGYRSVTAAELPVNAADYLSAGVVVLNDVPADGLSTGQQRALAGYVRDLGGGLVIGGGDHAFAAGGYGGTPLDAVSPLASDPPRPVERWVVLVDGSGSMAGGGGAGPTPWQIECEAVARLVPTLPPADPVRVGSFADAVRWWADEDPARGAIVAPPPGLLPTGRTNLSAALADVVGGSDRSAPTHLVLMTDADAGPPDVVAVSAAMRRQRTTLHLLATGDGPALAALRAICVNTGGSVVRQSDPAGWVAAARQLTRTAVPQRIERTPVAVTWHGDVAGPRTVPTWNRTWNKPDVTPLADAADAPMAATSAVGTGHATAVAFAADAGLLAELARGVESAAHDPRFTVTWSGGSNPHVTVDAADAKHYLNRLTITAEVDDAPAIPVAQVGPGLYEADVPSPPRPAVATVRVDGRVVDRLAVPGRYPAEFDVVGNDRGAMAEIATRTGGAVILPTDAGRLTLPGPLRRTDLGPPLSIGGATAAASGLVWWRRRRR